MPDQPAFRSNDARPARSGDEMLPIGEERRTREVAPRDCDEMLVGDRAIARPRPLSARGCHDGAAGGRWTRRRSVAHRVANGRLTRMLRGVYRVGPIAAPYSAEMAALLATERCAELSLLGDGLGRTAAVRRPGPRDRHESRPKPRGRQGPPIRLPRCRRSQRPDPHDTRENAARPRAAAEPRGSRTGRGGGRDPWARHGERGAAAVRGLQRAGTDALGGGATAATTHQGGQAAAGR